MDKKDFNKRLSEISNAFSVARNKIKAQESNFKITPRELKDPMSKFNAGKPITGAELQKISENWQSKAPLIDEEGNAFVLYIPDWQFNFSKGRNNPEDLHKYHVSWCGVLEYMQEKGRFKRYIKKTNIESNIFLGKQVDDRNAQSVLYACKTCKKKMIEVEGHDLYFDVENMDMLKFFAKYGKQNLLEPKTNRPYSVVYPKHWREISKKYREQANWKCADCGKSFESNHSMLDVHHIDGIRSNVSKTNLKVLCKECHSNQPFHAHYKNVLRTRQRTEQKAMPAMAVNAGGSVSSSQRNKLASFVANPDRYATGSDKAKQKVLEAIQTFEAIKGEMSQSEQKDFLNAIRIYKEAITNKV